MPAAAVPDSLDPAAPVPAPPPRPAPPLRERGTVRHEELRTSRWELKGIAKVVRSADLGEAAIDGTLVVGGSLSAEELRSDGALELQGPVTVRGRLLARGTVRAGSTVRAGEAELSGSVRLAGDLEVGGNLRSRGSLAVPSVRAGAVELHGSASVPGTIRARSVLAELDGDSSFGAIEAGSVQLRGPTSNLVTKALLKFHAVKVGRIEADQVRLESVRVAFVRAPEIVLGRESHLVAYEGTIRTAHPTSRTGPESWTAPPHGLRR